MIVSAVVGGVLGFIGWLAIVLCRVGGGSAANVLSAFEFAVLGFFAGAWIGPLTAAACVYAVQGARAIRSGGWVGRVRVARLGYLVGAAGAGFGAVAALGERAHVFGVLGLILAATAVLLFIKGLRLGRRPWQ
jgi:hypothetical protein